MFQPNLKSLGFLILFCDCLNWLLQTTPRFSGCVCFLGPLKQMGQRGACSYLRSLQRSSLKLSLERHIVSGIVPRFVTLIYFVLPGTPQPKTRVVQPWNIFLFWGGSQKLLRKELPKFNGWWSRLMLISKESCVKGVVLSNLEQSATNTPNQLYNAW